MLSFMQKMLEEQTMNFWLRSEEAIKSGATVLNIQIQQATCHPKNTVQK
jgi:hypothetical protein